MNKYFLLVFKNTNDAMMGEKYLKGKGYTVKVMPTPSQIINSCGLSLLLKEDEVDKVKQELKDDKVQYKALYSKDSSSFELIM